MSNKFLGLKFVGVHKNCWSNKFVVGVGGCGGGDGGGVGCWWGIGGMGWRRLDRISAELGLQHRLSVAIFLKRKVNTPSIFMSGCLISMRII